MLKIWKKRERQPRTLQSIISKELRCSRRNIYIADKHLDLISTKEMYAFLAYDNTNEGEYKDELWDCDNFSLAFKAAAQQYFMPKGINAAVGIIWTYKHAFNISVNKNFKVRLWEPQTGKRCFLDGRVRLVMM